MLLLYFAIMIIVVAGGAVLLRKFTVRVMGKVAGERINRIHTSVEHIYQTHKVPPAWQAELGRRLDELRDPGGSPERVRIHQERAKRTCMRRLGDLISYVRRSSLVESEEARRLLIDGLSQVKEEWSRETWQQMTE
jgi:hypothetical protein